MTNNSDHWAKILAFLLMVWAIATYREDIALVDSFVKVNTFTTKVSSFFLLIQAPGSNLLIICTLLVVNKSSENVYIVWTISHCTSHTIKMLEVKKKIPKTTSIVTLVNQKVFHNNEISLNWSSIKKRTMTIRTLPNRDIYFFYSLTTILLSQRPIFL